MVVYIVYVTFHTLCEEIVNIVMTITFNNAFCFMIIIPALVVKVEVKVSWP
jgi:hypothetical protein